MGIEEKYRRDEEEIRKTMPPVYVAFMDYSKDLRRMTQTIRADVRDVAIKLRNLTFDSIACCFVAANTFDIEKKVFNLLKVLENTDINFAGLHYLREHEGISIGQYGELTHRLMKAEKQVGNWLNTERRRTGSASTEH